jgi:hypothetical protein
MHVVPYHQHGSCPTCVCCMYGLGAGLGTGCCGSGSNDFALSYKDILLPPSSSFHFIKHDFFFFSFSSKCPVYFMCIVNTL